MRPLTPFRISSKRRSAPLLALWALAAGLLSCSIAATYEGMIPESFETVHRIPQAVQVSVSGGDNEGTVGKPQITDLAFRRALVESIKRSGMFSEVVADHRQAVQHLLSVTIFSVDSRTFGRVVKLEAGWTLRRGDTREVVWQESIISESRDFNIQVATEGAARNNIAQGLAKLSKLAVSAKLDR